MQPQPRRSWFRRLASAVGRLVTGRQPATPAPQPEPEPGFGPDYGDYIDYREPEPEDFGWEPEEFDREITIYDALGEYIGSNTKEGWFQELLLPKEELIYLYGYDNIDLIYALIEAGEWDDYDWETWREIYNTV